MKTSYRAKARLFGSALAALIAVTPAVAWQATPSTASSSLVYKVPPNPAYGKVSAQKYGHDKFEKYVFAMINYQRSLRGLRKLTLSSCPDRYATAWARKLTNSRTIYHRDMGALLRACRVTMAGENIIRADASTVSTDLVRYWMESPSHRANILNAKYTYIGLYTSCSTTRGCTTVTNFTRK
ncbi:MAG: CAP domain-containing protein [Actinomycetota bacterium]